MLVIFGVIFLGSGFRWFSVFCVMIRCSFLCVGFVKVFWIVCRLNSYMVFVVVVLWVCFLLMIQVGFLDFCGFLVIGVFLVF